MLIPLTEAQKKSAKVIGKAYWSSAFKAQYPNATAEERSASWKQSHKQYTKLGTSVVRRMIKEGCSLA